MSPAAYAQHMGQHSIRKVFHCLADMDVYTLRSHAVLDLREHTSAMLFIASVEH